MYKQLAAQIVDLDKVFGFNPFGIFDLPGSSTENGVLLLFRNLIIIILAVLFVAWVFMAIYIGIKFITSLGSPEQIGEAITSLKNLFVGITIMFIFFLLLFFITNFFMG